MSMIESDQGPSTVVGQKGFVVYCFWREVIYMANGTVETVKETHSLIVNKLQNYRTDSRMK